MHLLKKLYQWVLNLANKPLASLSLFFLALAESSFFPIPPDALLIPMCLGKRQKAILFALVCTVGSALGGILGYVIGSLLWWDGTSFSAFAEIVFRFVPGFTHEKFEHIQQLFETYNFWIVFSAGFTPLPYKVFTISAGACDINFGMFLLASVISRGARFFLVAGLIALFGEKIEIFIEKYFNLVTILALVFLIGGFLLLKVF